MFIDRQQIKLNHLYSIVLPNSFNSQQGAFKPYIFINSGTVDVYGNGGLAQPQSLSDLVLEDENTAVDGFDIFDLIPSYIVVKQNTGTSTEIVVSGLRLNDLGEL